MSPTPPLPSPTPDPVRDWAESGVAALTGRPDGPPVIPPGRAATVARAMSSWISDVAALGGRRIDVDGARLLSERAAFTGRPRRGNISVGGSCRLLSTADGWAAVSCARPDDPALLGALIGDAVDEGDPWPAVADWLRTRTGAELAERAELLGVAAGPVSRAGTPPPVPEPLHPRPVDGLLVVDFSSLWAGPLCAHLLGLAGVRVVKVETPDRPDGARRGNPDFYRLLHGGHESVVLDPATGAGRRALAAIVDAADIVVEASRPRALARFGLDAAAAVARGTTWVSITAAGRSSGRIGFGDDLAAAAGLVASDPDGTPLFVGDALADPLTGITAAALAMSAPADGSGRLWDLSMSDLIASTLTDQSVPQPLLRDGKWVVKTSSGAAAVAEPRPRTPAGNAAPSGADTAAVLASLGIAAP
ncbi:CoA transferase [Rhodococcus opacus]|uniref:CoA transferase n=1 Tax=Rhodococcus opacus TaxID=37919 RepID=UPI000EA86A98|nr:CoA transferase [Rhodococcus opacus]RKM65202.1 CoA transferase [Rhodococcus opacus]